MGEQNTGIASPNDLHAAPERVVKNKKSDSNLYGILILLTVLLVGGAGFFFLQQLRSEQEGLGGALDKGDRRIATLNEHLTALQNQMSTVQSQIANVQNELSNRESKFEREIAGFKEYQSAQIDSVKSKLENSIQNIQGLLNRTRGDWMIADAEYLLSVAIQRLNLVGDVKTSLVALQAADERLRDSGNPGVYKVRQQLAREIGSLKGLKPVDIVGVFAKIRILEEQVGNLPIFLPHAGEVRQNNGPAEEQSPSGEISGVNEFLDSAIEDLKGLVVVRRSDREIDVILQPEEVRIIREELKIKLELARLALMERDSKLFLEALNEIQNWLKANFRVDASASKKFLSEVQALNQIGLDIDYPDISASLKMLENIAALRVEQDQSEAGAKKTSKTNKKTSQKPEGAAQ